MFQAITDGDCSEQGDTKVKNTPATAKKHEEAEHSHRQQRLRNDQHTYGNFDGLLPAVMLPLRQIPIVLDALGQVPDKQQRSDSRARCTIDEIWTLQPPGEDRVTGSVRAREPVVCPVAPAPGRRARCSQSQQPALRARLPGCWTCWSCWGAGRRGAGGSPDPRHTSSIQELGRAGLCGTIAIRKETALEFPGSVSIGTSDQGRQHPIPSPGVATATTTLQRGGSLGRPRGSWAKRHCTRSQRP
mmetsp:Transcript_1447/g.3654  ORF Transcript_1447/g.3654 Transcript_1447/m.3654 type:complete len:244 (-) Transcript_1447:3-734(-)